jgi:hypothetical protein
VPHLTAVFSGVSVLDLRPVLDQCQSVQISVPISGFGPLFGGNIFPLTGDRAISTHTAFSRSEVMRSKRGKGGEASQSSHHRSA